MAARSARNATMLILLWSVSLLVVLGLGVGLWQHWMASTTAGACNRNKVCEPKKGETFWTCNYDCQNPCGNGKCEKGLGETTSNCRSDCLKSCGNGKCDRGETRAICPNDCTCGNGACEPAKKENSRTCPSDCKASNGTNPVGNGTPQVTPPSPSGNGSPQTTPPTGPCGDGICDNPNETLRTCRKDCTCGNRVCEPAERQRGDCDKDCPSGGHCGDNVCDFSIGESATACAFDCPTCGDGNCVNGEYWDDCPKDCDRRLCGNGTCDVDEGEQPANCPQDCPRCGDGVCDPVYDEYASTCPQDCPCGNGVLEEGEQCDPDPNVKYFVRPCFPRYCDTDTCQCVSTPTGHTGK